MSATKRKPKADKTLEQARQRGLADALAQERLALAAITKVMMLEVDSPQRVLGRLDAMARAASENRKVPSGTRRALIDGVRLVRRTIERERGDAVVTQPTLLDPPRPEPKPERVDELAAATDGPQQLGLVANEAIEDAELAHEDRVATIATVHGALVELIKADGASTDDELHHRYALRVLRGDALPQQTKTAIMERRRELVAAGRLRVAVKGDRKTDPRYDIVERDLLEAAS